MAFKFLDHRVLHVQMNFNSNMLDFFQSVKSKEEFNIEYDIEPYEDNVFITYNLNYTNTMDNEEDGVLVIRMLFRLKGDLQEIKEALKKDIHLYCYPYLKTYIQNLLFSSGLALELPM